MPDLVNPEWNDNKLKHIVWNDEKCASCLNSGSCPLIALLYTHEILTHSGIHVSRCKLYEPDKSSEYYVDDPEDLVQISKINVAALEQQMELLSEMLLKVSEEAGLEDSSGPNAK
jgi:hypothetical protein